MEPKTANCYKQIIECYLPMAENVGVGGLLVKDRKINFDKRNEFPNLLWSIMSIINKNFQYV